MNRLSYKYGDGELSLFIDGKYLNTMLDEFIDSNNYFKFLVPSLKLDNVQQQRYVWDLIDNKASCNFPLLVCGDDLDFSCTISVVEIEFQNNIVTWHRLGRVIRDENFFDNWRNSGVRNIEEWSEDDWHKYGTIAYDLLHDDKFFDKWCSENWAEEDYRRTWGYYHQSFNNNSGIEWLAELNFTFNPEEYRCIFEMIKRDIQ